jgi:hypothetical protein
MLTPVTWLKAKLGINITMGRYTKRKLRMQFIILALGTRVIA